MTFFKHVPFVILALTFATFGISTGEFVMPGLLVQIAQEFGIGVDKTGLLVSAYAFGVVFGALGQSAYNHGDYKDAESKTKVCKVLGIISLVLFILAFLFLLFFFFVIGVSSTPSTYYSHL